MSGGGGKGGEHFQIARALSKAEFVSSLDGVTDTLIEMRLPLAMLACNVANRRTFRFSSTKCRTITVMVTARYTMQFKASR